MLQVIQQEHGVLQVHPDLQTQVWVYFAFVPIYFSKLVIQFPNGYHLKEEALSLNLSPRTLIKYFFLTTKYSCERFSFPLADPVVTKGGQAKGFLFFPFFASDFKTGKITRD